jgi:hypothetical protein
MVNSFVWTSEEARYIKAILRWQANPPDNDNDRNTPSPSPSPTSLKSGTSKQKTKQQQQQQQQHGKPAGELRMLVIGAQGVGKTALLTRVGLF